MITIQSSGAQRLFEHPVLLATSFGHNGHHQSISQKLIKSGTYSAKWDPIYIYINKFITSFKIINSLKMCYL